MRISDWSSDVGSADLPPAVDALVLRVMVRKQLADITAGDRAEQRITERVDERITIGMRDDAIFAGNEHTAELHAVARFESMRVVAMADSQPRRSEERRGGKECVSSCRSRGSAVH